MNAPSVFLAGWVHLAHIYYLKNNDRGESTIEDKRKVEWLVARGSKNEPNHLEPLEKYCVRHSIRYFGLIDNKTI